MKTDHDLKRVLGPTSAVCVVVGAIIGVGIFFTPTNVAAIAGSAPLAMITWGVCGLLALCGALSFAELGGLYPTTGGQYDILRDAYGSPVGFLYVFCNATAIQAGAIAIIAFIAAGNLGVVLHGRPLGDVPAMVVAIAMIVGLVIANGMGVRWGAAVQNMTVFAKLATLVVVTCLATTLAAAPDAPDATAAPDGSTPAHPVALVFAALVPAFFAFGGWQQALWMGGEMRDPEKNVPRAIIIGVLVVVAVYLAVNWAYFRLLGYQGVAQSDALAADAVARVWPSAGRRIIAGAVAVSAFGVLNAQLLSGPRLVYRMAQDGRFFAALAHIHATRRTPIVAIVSLGGLGIALLLGAGAEGVDQILTGVVLIDAFFFLLTGLALIVLRRTRGGVPRPVRVPLYPLVPLLFVAGEAAIMVGAFLDEHYRRGALVGVLWVAAAAGFYLVGFRRSD